MNNTEASYAYAERLARAEAKNFYYTFLFLPPERRRALCAIYAYSRRLDDAVDAIEQGDGPSGEAHERLAFLRSLLSLRPPEDPLVAALRDTIDRFGIPLTFFEELIEGMYMDLRQRRYETFEDLYLYCYRAASVVGLICIEIFGYESEGARKPAEELGIAMQLTNILRDVAEDLERDRIYIPQEDLTRFGYAESDLRARVVDDRFRSLMRFEAGRARDYFERSEVLFPMVSPESRYCPVLLKRLYAKILERIERRDFDVFSRRARLPLYQKLLLVASTWLECRRAAAARRTRPGDASPTETTPNSAG